MSFVDESWYQKPQDIPEQQSAGGVVVRKEDGRVLVALVQERGHGDFVLPKGRMEPGETNEQTAIREVEEEAGFEKLTLHSLLGAEERLAFDRKTWKTTHFFLFQTDEIEVEPKDTEHHEVTTWFPVDALPKMFWPEQQKLIEDNLPLIRELFR